MLQCLIIHLGDNLGHILRLSVHGHNDIFLVHAGEGHKSVYMIDAFLFQKLMIRRIAMDDGRLRQKLTQFSAASPVPFNNLYIHS